MIELERLAANLMPELEQICSDTKDVHSFPELLSEGISEDEDWRVSLETAEVEQTPGAVKMIYTVRRKDSLSPEMTSRLRFRFNEWSTDNYVFAPGTVYAGNRFRFHEVEYPVQYVSEEYLGKMDMPTTISRGFHLNTCEGESSIFLDTGDVTTPAFGFYSPEKKRGVLIFVPQESWLGNYGLSIEESADRAFADFSVSAPSSRGETSGDTGVHLRPDEEVEISLQMHVFEADDIKGFLRVFCECRKVVTGQNSFTQVYPYSAGCKDIIARYREKNWQEDNQVIGMNAEQRNRGPDWSFLGQWQTGWCFGGLQLPALFAKGNALDRERVVTTINTIFSEIQAERGFFYANYTDQKPVGDFWKERGETTTTCLIRRQGDMLHSLIKTFQTMETCSQVVNPEWLACVRKGCDALVRLWKRYGQLGQFIDVDSEEILVAGSTSGASAIIALAEASAYFEHAEYMQVAKEIGSFFDKEYLAKGYTCGGPGEAGQAPDSESSYALLAGYWNIYENSSEPEWLQLCEDAANLFTTWCVSHDFKFPSGSLFAEYNIKATGTVVANTQNRHSAPGICTASGDALLKLYRATGNRRYLDLINEIAHNITQFISREQCVYPLQKATWVNERVNISDWEGRHNVGNDVFSGTCWSESSCLLTFLDFPSVYICPDLEQIICFDHVTAEWVEIDGHCRLMIHNPTTCDAELTVLAENEAERKRLYKYELLGEYAKIIVKAGERIFINSEFLNCQKC